MGSITPTPYSSRLFQPPQLGATPISLRIAMAPLTRYRATDEYMPTPLMREYYVQRAASVPGTLMLTEGTFITQHQGGLANAPGIWNRAQIDAWRDIVDAVHARGARIFCQLWAIGLAVQPGIAAREGWVPKTSSVTALVGDEEQVNIGGEGEVNAAVQAQAMTREEIEQTVQDYAQAARNAMEAGFDGVKIHAANGYLIDQFIQDRVDQRTDEYGGSIENRSRFAAEVVDAAVSAVGAQRTAIRFSPFSTYGGMGMERQAATAQFTDVIRRIAKHDLAYLHLVEPRIAGNADVDSRESLDFAYDRNLWSGRLLIAGGHTPESARRLVEEKHPDRDIVVVFGRSFIANPDLPYRIREGIELTPWFRPTFYQGGPKGYTDYPYSKEFEASLKV